MTTRVGVFGAGGRMGALVCRTVADDPQLQLVAAVDGHHAGLDVREVTGADIHGVQVARDPAAFADAGVEVAVDFTVLEGARQNARWCAANGVHAVIGTSGFTAEECESLRPVFTTSNCIVVANFAIGAVLMMRFAELAAPFFETAEIIELHHDGKIDAPSGTALETASRLAAAPGSWSPDPTVLQPVEGVRGGEGPGGIRIHSVRMRGLVASQEVVLGTTGQTITIRHDTYDRSSFMPGVVLAVKGIAGLPGVTVGLDALLGL